jgi:hypothetical protein
MPRMREVIMVKNRVKRRFPPANSTSPFASFSPKPVRVTTPIMIPAEAQARATPTAFLAPSSKASAISLRLMRVDFLKAPARTQTASPISAA